MSAEELKINVTELPPEGRRVEGNVPFSDLQIDADERFRCPTPLFYSLHVAPVGRDVLVRGRLRATLEAACDRCLESVQTLIHTNGVCHLYEEVDEVYIDLTDDVREDILLVFPQAVLCREDCLGLCASCGRNLNEDACECDREGSSEGPWAALSDLDLPPE